MLYSSNLKTKLNKYKFNNHVYICFFTRIIALKYNFTDFYITYHINTGWLNSFINDETKYEQLLSRLINEIIELFKYFEIIKTIKTCDFL